MSIWNQYPETYRAVEIRTLLDNAGAGECSAVVGLSGAGKSNLMGFLVHRAAAAGRPKFILIDCNRLSAADPAAFVGLLAEELGGRPSATLRELETEIDRALKNNPGGVCLVLDRFDALSAAAGAPVAGQLRALRDRFKYELTLITAARRPPDAHNELAELFYAHTLWLGPLAPADAWWSAGQYAARRGLNWEPAVFDRVLEFSWGYPALLRAVCEAHAAGCALEQTALIDHPAVRLRAAEFWADAPSADDIRRSGLQGQPLLTAHAPGSLSAAVLTAAEQRLLDYLRARPGQVCTKNELISAVWPDEVVAEGLRDDSLAQLVHRLREKIEPDPARPRLLLTVAGRGYRFGG